MSLIVDGATDRPKLGEMRIGAFRETTTWLAHPFTAMEKRGNDAI
ncbi:hypothetical protein ACVWW7_004785 [Bradyrhizobium sp. LM6.9]